MILSLELVEVEVDVVTIEEVVVCSLELVLEDDWLGAEQATNKRAPNAINIKDFLLQETLDVINNYNATGNYTSLLSCSSEKSVKGSVSFNTV